MSIGISNHLLFLLTLSELHREFVMEGSLVQDRVVWKYSVYLKENKTSKTWKLKDRHCFAHFWRFSVPDKNTTSDNSSWDNEPILFFFCLESDQTRCLKGMFLVACMSHIHTHHARRRKLIIMFIRFVSNTLMRSKAIRSCVTALTCCQQSRFCTPVPFLKHELFL
jgi:hypothetical protein